MKDRVNQKDKCNKHFKMLNMVERQRIIACLFIGELSMFGDFIFRVTNQQLHTSIKMLLCIKHIRMHLHDLQTLLEIIAVCMLTTIDCPMHNVACINVYIVHNVYSSLHECLCWFIGSSHRRM